MHRYIERAREEAGFTLIELLIVIVILGILAGVVVFSVGGITDRGNVAACKTDLSTVDRGGGGVPGQDTATTRRTSTRR